VPGAPATGIALAALVAACAPSREEQIALHTATIDRYCLDCHNAVDREGGLVLEGIDLADVRANAGGSPPMRWPTRSSGARPCTA
jgi:hypothetical protein